MSAKGRSRFIGSSLLIIVCAGCGYEPPGKPFEYPTTTLSGKILFGETPIQGGWLTVLPFGGTVGDHRIVPIANDGSFEIQDAPIGTLEVHVALGALQRETLSRKFPPQAQRLFAFLKQISLPNDHLKTTTKAEGENRYDVDLLDLALKAMAEGKL